jgi:hypothetical protein
MQQRSPPNRRDKTRRSNARLPGFDAAIFSSATVNLTTRFRRLRFEVLVAAGSRILNPFFEASKTGSWFGGVVVQKQGVRIR